MLSFQTAFKMLHIVLGLPLRITCITGAAILQAKYDGSRSCQPTNSVNQQMCTVQIGGSTMSGMKFSMPKYFAYAITWQFRIVHCYSNRVCYQRQKLLQLLLHQLSDLLFPKSNITIYPLLIFKLQNIVKFITTDRVLLFFQHCPNQR